MKSKWFLTGILSILLVFGLVLTGCPTDGGDDNGGTNNGGDDNGGTDNGGSSLTWKAVSNTTFGLYRIEGIAYGNGKFVAVGYSGEMAYSNNQE